MRKSKCPHQTMSPQAACSSCYWLLCYLSGCVQMLPLFNRSEDDNTLLLRLVSAAGTDIQATEGGGVPEVTMPMLRNNERLLQLLLHGWLQADSCLDMSGALSVRRCSAVFGLWCSLERVRANEAHAYSHTSPLACRCATPCIFLSTEFDARKCTTNGESCSFDGHWSRAVRFEWVVQARRQCAVVFGEHAPVDGAEGIHSR